VHPEACPDKVFYVFGTDTYDHWVSRAGEVERFWILDVEGQVLLLSTTTGPGATAGQVQQLARIVESAQFATGD
jgi:hypothetical protein